MTRYFYKFLPRAGKATSSEVRCDCVKICTDYCVKNKDEIRNILSDIADVAKNSLPNINSSVLKESRYFLMHVISAPIQAYRR